ncbi:MAG: YqgE/AlgH family protein [Pedosphaera sp.]|nr:YqgE/AlgH family protein [Pedosphaera sp.]
MPSAHKSLKGQLLLDGGRLAGSYFHRTVVLVCEHTADGAFGLILNRPSKRELGESVDGKLPKWMAGQPLFEGGPILPAAMSFLHSAPVLLQANILPNLSKGHDLAELIELGSDEAAGRKLRVFGGYAGWSPGQLDDEMRREAWLTHPGSIELVFEIEPQDLWRHLLRQRLRWQERLIADSPDDLSWN